MNPRSRFREKDDRRKLILAAAEHAFGESGYHDASLTRIADRAGFAVGTLYLYFEDKADLYGSVLLTKMHAIVAEFESALKSSTSASTSLRAAIHSQFTFHDANRRFFEIFLHQHQVQSSVLHRRHWEELEKLKKRNLDLIEKCVARGQAHGEIKPGPPRLFAVGFLGMMLQMVRQHIREENPRPLTDSADFAAELFLTGASKL